MASATEILVRSDLLLDGSFAKPERPCCAAATAEAMPEEDVFEGLDLSSWSDRYEAVNILEDMVESGVFLQWEAVIREEQGLPLSDAQEEAIEDLVSFSDEDEDEEDAPVLYIEGALGAVFNDPRFIPYIQRHEFEVLVLAALPSLHELLDAEDDLAGLKALKASLGSAAPEEINDGETPSKRLLAHIPSFSKTLHGPLATGATGLASIRAQCPRFDAWVTSLESLHLR